MMTNKTISLVVLLVVSITRMGMGEILLVPNPERFTLKNAESMQRGAAGTLAPVYAPLAEWMVAKLDLAEREGIGIDLGSGPGTLIVELCKRTKRMHWINADINTFVFPFFYENAKKAGFGERCSAIFSDAQAMPFRDNYADAIVSRGCYPFWDNKIAGFAEVYRVLKPGGTAIIGRGFPENFPAETAQQIREEQKDSKIIKYDPEQAETELRDWMRELKIDTYEIIHPQPPTGEKLNYGIWVVIEKP